MKKRILSLLTGVGCITMLSCKHQIPADVNSNGTGIQPSPPLSASCSADTVYFQQQVLPLFLSNCAMSGCHDAASHRDGVILTSYATIMSFGQIQPGNPSNSKVFKKITDPDNDDRMPPPPKMPLKQEQVNAIRTWILQGAKNNSCQSSACDTAAITFSTTIRNIINNECLGCHSGTAPGGGYDFTGYAGIKARIDDGKLWGAVNHLAGFSPMPKNNNPLSACELLQIKKWMDAGAPNN